MHFTSAKITCNNCLFSVLDSTGKTPDGVLGDVSTLCEFMNDWVKPGFCDDLNDEVADLVDIIIPRGNTVAFGSFEGSSESPDYDPSFHTLFFRLPESGGPPQQLRPASLGPLPRPALHRQAGGELGNTGQGSHDQGSFPSLQLLQPRPEVRRHPLAHRRALPRRTHPRGSF